MMCTTPFEATLSAEDTGAPPTVTTSPSFVMVISLEASKVSTVAGKSADMTLPLMTWYFKRLANSSSESVSNPPAALKASSVGAKTVKGPSPFKTVDNLAFVTASNNFDKVDTDAARSTMSFRGSSGTVSTLSMMCTTPFEATLSAPVTLASPPTVTTSPSFVMVRSLEVSKVGYVLVGSNSPDMTLSLMTWYFKRLASSSLLTSSNPSGYASSKAASVGAKTVKGPTPFKTVAKSAFVTAATNFDKVGVATARST